MPRGKRTRLAIGIYRDAIGHAIIVRRHSRRVEHRYPQDKALGWLKNERERLIATLDRKGPRGHNGTFAGDVATYLSTLPDGRSKQDRADWLRPWLEAFGTEPREAITAQRVRELMATWPHGPSTLNHRRHALRAVFHLVDPDAPTPVDRIPRIREHREVRVIPRAVVVAVLRQLPPGATAARLKLLARTGWPHAQISRLQPHDVNYQDRLVRIRGRRKGGGVTDRVIPITHAALRALRLFDRYAAWGAFDRHNTRKVFLQAVQQAQATWPGIWPAPENFHPYDLRHAFISHALERSGGNLLATSWLALHSDVSMTAFYAGAAASPMALAVRDALDRKSANISANIPPQKATVTARKRGSKTAVPTSTVTAKKARNR